MNFLVKCITISLLMVSCGTTHRLKKAVSQRPNESHFFKGFVLFNPKTKKEILNINGDKYFTPASNTKLYTFYTAYKTLKDSVPGLAYCKTKDSLIIKGTADPSFLYGFENNNNVINFLKEATDSIYMVDESIDETPFGSGWAWDDYQENYMPDKSLFPIHGNTVKYFSDADTIVSEPSFFKSKITLLDSTDVKRLPNKNVFYFERNSEEPYEVPFITSNKLVAKLLSDVLSKRVKLIHTHKEYDFKILYSLTYDELFKKMLVDSDNMIAEQLMLQVSKAISDKYSTESAIKYALDNYLKDLPQEPRWVDGSGLSRYNLFSPNDMVFLLNKMYREIPFEKLLHFLPVGGKSGTLKNILVDNKPFVYAKSGSLSNNYNLSGYIITKKGTHLIFSYMNNHYRTSTSLLKDNIEKTLQYIYNKY